ncbi:MAG: RDD family protein, partial [Gemmatimonadales bacterium]
MPALREIPTDYRQHLEIETPEHVVLDLEIAGIGSRALAAVLDMLILMAAGIALLTILVILASYGIGVGRPGAILLMLGSFLAWNGYFILFEGLRRGQTPGKRIAGIRVVMDTGHAVTFGAAAARNLLRVADFLPPPYLIGVLLVAFHPRAKRLGDMVAGTVVSRDRPQEALSARSAPTEPEPPASIPELGDEDFR